MNETIRIIKNRKSLRSYENKEISREDTDMIIHGATRAPTAGNMMLYSIIEVDDQKKKEALVKTCDDQPFIAKAPLVLIFLADFQRWVDTFQAYSVPEYCKENNLDYIEPQEADLLLACCDALIAAQNAVITAESMGIGSCYIGDIMENIEIHREMFNLPPYVFPITMLCFGYYKQKDKNKKPRSRFPQKFIHHKGEYQHFNREDFDEMFQESIKQFTGKNSFIKNAQNIGQHHYIRKTGSDFAEEMRRSVRVALENWQKK